MRPSSDGLASLGLGCWAFGKGYWLDQERQDSIKTIHSAIRSGIRHFDTAQGYGKGASEQLTGQQLRRFSKTFPRDSYTLATKLFLPDDSSALEPLVLRSLHRLCTTYIDILYIHWPDSSKPLDPYLKELARLRKKGLFRMLGVSNFTETLLVQAISAVEISYCQMPVSLVWMKSLRTLGLICNENQIKIVGYSPLALGLLSGRYRTMEDLKDEDLRRRLFPFQQPYHHAYLHLLDSLSEVARRYGTSSAIVALYWARRQSVDTILTGARTKEQFSSALRSGFLHIDNDSLKSVEDAAGALADLIPDEEDNLFFHRW